MKYKNILIVYGCGGHSEQAMRLSTKIVSSSLGSVFFTVTDTGIRRSYSVRHLEIGHLRDKLVGLSIGSILRYFSQSYRIYKFIRDNNIDFCFSLGPGVSILPAIICRVVGVQVVHIETWSRFYGLSNTSRVMRFIADDLWIQNRELHQRVKLGKFVGRL